MMMMMMIMMMIKYESVSTALTVYTLITKCFYKRYIAFSFVQIVRYF
jgi:hypothetical protein